MIQNLETNYSSGEPPVTNARHIRSSGGGGEVKSFRDSNNNSGSRMNSNHMAISPVAKQSQEALESPANSYSSSSSSSSLTSPSTTSASATSTTTTIREIKTMGSLSPLHIQAPVSNATSYGPARNKHINLLQQQQQQQLRGNTQNQPVRNSHHQAYHIQFDRRQAISMERLENLHHSNSSSSIMHSRQNGAVGARMHTHHSTHNIGARVAANAPMNTYEAREASGSLSSGGGSQTSLDDVVASEICAPERKSSCRTSTGLTRSASRVSRFRSAKEFFERLSSVNNPKGAACASGGGGGVANNISATLKSNSAQSLRSGAHSNDVLQQQSANNSIVLKPALLDKPRGSVVNRYAANVIQLTTAASVPSVARAADKPQAQQQQHPAPTVTQNNASPTRPRLNIKPVAAPQAPIKLTPNNNNNMSPNSESNKQPAPVSSSPISPKPDNTSTHDNIVTTVTNSSTASPFLTATITTTTNKANNSTVTSTLYKFNGDCDQAPSHLASLCGADSPLLSPRSDLNQSVCAFEGDNVIVGNGSLLNKRNKQLKIKFDETCTLTFEYPSEEAMLAEPDTPEPAANKHTSATVQRKSSTDDITAPDEHQSATTVTNDTSSSQQSAQSTTTTTLNNILKQPPNAFLRKSKLPHTQLCPPRTAKLVRII